MNIKHIIFMLALCLNIQSGSISFVGGMLFGMEENISVKYITSLPCVINKSGVYKLSPDVKDNGKTKGKFDAAIRIYGNVNVYLDLQGNTLYANGRHFGIDANFAHSVMITNGVISGAVIGIGAIYSDVRLRNVMMQHCEISVEANNKQEEEILF